MAKQKQSEPKSILEREYIVPLRHGWLKVPEYKRANKAVKTLKEFIAKHMKVYDRDLRKIKIEQDLNNEIRFRGMRKPPSKIKVKAIKLDNDTVRVELIDLPAHIKFERLREEKKKAELNKKAKAKEEQRKQAEEMQKKVEEEKQVGESEETKEKEAASKEETLKIAKEQAKEIKHTSKDQKVQKQVQTQRKALAK
tara:strand:+ start:65 stop:652 length:588 start_codon:yes stop_codon:yes gene_type:complete